MKRALIKVLFALFIPITSISVSVAQDRNDTLHRHNKSLNSIAFPKDMQWYNTNSEFKVDKIFDKILVIHVWEPGSIHAEESILRANEIQRERRDVIIITIINASSKKFDEKTVNEVVKAYHINHSIGVSSDLSSLKRITQGLPAMILSINQGERLAEYTGMSCGNKAKELLETVSQAKTLNISDIKSQISLPTASITGPFLRASSLVASDAEQRFFVADALHHRVLMMDVSGSVVEIIGSGVKGFRDGTFGNCQLNYPTGLALDHGNRQLYISEPFNHVIRRIDLKTGEIKTVLGNGKEAKAIVAEIDSTTASISYPTDIAFSNGKLMIAMSGWNQIWEYSPDTRQAKIKLGSGMKVSYDGHLGEASLDTPEKLTFDDAGNWYIYDAGSQSLRFLADGKLMTIVDSKTPMPQSTMGIPAVGDMTCIGKTLYVTDTERNRILVMENDKWSVLSGQVEAGNIVGKGKKSKFNHPTGLDVSNGQLLVLDGYNNAVKEIRLKKGKSRNLEMKNMDILYKNYEAYADGDRVYLPAVEIGEGINNIYLQLDWKGKYSIYPDGRNEVFLEQSNFNSIVSGSPTRGFVEIEVESAESNQYVDLQMYITVKEKSTGMIWFRPVLLVIPFEYVEGTSPSHDIKWAPFE